jgi:hypothetical protein
MTDRHIIKLLWADDDSKQLLDPLSWDFEEAGFLLQRATDYLEAKDILDTQLVHSLLVDIILPPGIMGTYLGLDLAQHAAERGVRNIAFLTVVPQESVVSERYNMLVTKHPQVRFWFYDKLLLAEPLVLEALIDNLKPL